MKWLLHSIQSSGSLTRWKTISFRVQRSSSLILNDRTSRSDESLVDASNAPSDFSTPCAVVYSNFLTPEEGDLLADHVSKRMCRRRYEKGHWDAVITNYKEVELADDTIDDDRIAEMLERTRRLLESNHLGYQPVRWLPCHSIELKADGELTAHVDSVKFSGDLVAGVSLRSPAIMRLAPHIDGGQGPMEGHVDLFLPPLSLYVLTGVARYRYSHELMKNGAAFHLPDGSSSVYLDRENRLSVIFRDAKRD